MIFQLYIRLHGIEPPIWRRIQVRGGISLYRLNLLIQRAMGWENCHLSEFDIDGARYGWSEFDEEGLGVLEFRLHRITKSLLAKGKVFKFEYDFGDDWQHEIVVEDILQPEPGVAYPRCIGGERACPPEDVGGVPGYEEYLEAIMDPSHEEYNNLLKWRGPFDPEKFDAAAATKLMQKRRNN